jgi:hypothetical protein
MAPIPPAAFRRRLAALDPGEQARFVAAVYEARGVRARADGNRVVVRDGDRERTLRVPERGWRSRWPVRRLPVPVGDDGVVAFGADEVLEAGRLREMALYALAPAAREAVFERHLGVPPTGWDDGTAATPVTRWRRRAPERLAAAVALVAVAVLLAGAVTAPGTVPAVGATGVLGGQAPGATPTPTPTPAADDGPGPAAAWEWVDVTGTATVEGYPGAAAADATNPTGVASDSADTGVAATGISRERLAAERLADVHERAVENRSYTWTVTYREYRNGSEAGRLTAVVSVVNRTIYATNVTRTGRLETATAPIEDDDLYADGRTEYARGYWGNATARPVVSEGSQSGQFSEQAGALVYWYLTVEAASVSGPIDLGDVRFYRVRGEGDPYALIENATTRAIVNDRGVVYSLHRRQTLVGHPGTTIVVTFDYDFLTPALERPDWVPPAAADPPAVERTVNGSSGLAE